MVSPQYELSYVYQKHSTVIFFKMIKKSYIFNKFTKEKCDCLARINFQILKSYNLLGLSTEFDKILKDQTNFRQILI